MQITLTIEPDRLEHISDQYLAAYWHAVQAAPTEMGDADTNELAEKIGREIIRRFLAITRPLLWDKQGRHTEFDRRLTADNAARAASASRAELLDAIKETRKELVGTIWVGSRPDRLMDFLGDVIAKAEGAQP